MGLLNMIETFRDRSKTADKMFTEISARTLADRQDLVAQIAVIETTGAAACATLAAELAKTVTAVEATDRASKAASAAHGIAASALYARDRQIKTAISRITFALEAAADSSITDFIESLQAEAEGKRHSQSDQSPHYFTGLISAQKKAAALRFLAMTDDEVTAALDAIRAAVPSQYASAERNAA